MGARQEKPKQVKTCPCSTLHCPYCNEDFARDDDDVIARLGEVLRQLKDDRRFGVEFVLPSAPSIPFSNFSASGADFDFGKRLRLNLPDIFA